MDLDRLRDDVWALRRDPDDRVLGGVCSAVATRCGVDVLLVRLAAVLLGLGAGVGVVAYAWAWLVLPRRGSEHLLLSRWVPQASTWDRATHERVGTVAALVAAALLALVLPWSLGPATVVVALVVLGRRLPEHPSHPALAPQVPARRRPLSAARRRRALVAARPVRRRRHRHVLGWCTTAAGVALVAGSMVPRPLGATGLKADLLLASPADVAGAPTRVTGSRITYDLSALRPTGVQRVALEPSASNVTVVVPAGVPVRVEYHLVGSVLDVEAGDDQAHLVGFARGAWPDGPPGPGPALVLTVDARASAILVRHA